LSRFNIRQPAAATHRHHVDPDEDAQKPVEDWLQGSSRHAALARHSLTPSQEYVRQMIVRTAIAPATSVAASFP
jgi:hypothetical protein